MNLFEREERIAADEADAIAAVRAEVAAKQTAAAEAEARAAEAKAAEAKAKAAAKEAAGDDRAGDGADDSDADDSDADSSKDDSSSLADALAGPAPAPTSASSLITRASSDLTSPATVAAGFDQAGAARLLEEEVKDAVYSTVGAAGASFSSPCFSPAFSITLPRTCSPSPSPRRSGTSPCCRCR